jgi:hypothetical protein
MQTVPETTTPAVAAFPAKTAAPRKAAAKPAAKKAAAKPAAKKAAAPKVMPSPKAVKKLADRADAAKPTAKKAAAKPRSAAAKRAAPVPAKRVAKVAVKPATVAKPPKGDAPKFEARTIAQLQKILSMMPTGGSWAALRGGIQILNMRGRVIGEVKLPKVSTKK